MNNRLFWDSFGFNPLYSGLESEEQWEDTKLDQSCVQTVIASILHTRPHRPLFCLGKVGHGAGIRVNTRRLILVTKDNHGVAMRRLVADNAVVPHLDLPAVAHNQHRGDDNGDESDGGNNCDDDDGVGGWCGGGWLDSRFTVARGVLRVGGGGQGWCWCHERDVAVGCEGGGRGWACVFR